ncbi:hypothetical protein AAFF_G00428180 [Aldrovandia affinis]|uniref:Uncharacterized protein n=1 Tax=Aldrovandia affinis TaxID=143900 RepID=A0AAD7WIN5_9TELE|nr:hypothetical protein AAFF_G00428180 [Aldrovandia affinis]
MSAKRQWYVTVSQAVLKCASAAHRGVLEKGNVAKSVRLQTAFRLSGVGVLKSPEFKKWAESRSIFSAQSSLPPHTPARSSQLGGKVPSSQILTSPQETTANNPPPEREDEATSPSQRLNISARGLADILTAQSGGRERARAVETGVSSLCFRRSLI